MYTESNYFWGLVGYYLGALVVLWYVHWLLAKVAIRHLRNGLFLLAAALLLTPVQAYSNPDITHLAPAFLVYLFEGLVIGTEQDPNRALVPIVFVFLLLLAAYAGWLWWQHKRGKTAVAPEPDQPAPDQTDSQSVGDNNELDDKTAESA
ncbi:hypothetical protein KFE80_01500 [bacterium SCSIO 12696]|nr:hypothetical protein KFE80_01500 [bacterium SCSIO 12696]